MGVCSSTTAISCLPFRSMGSNRKTAVGSDPKITKITKLTKQMKIIFFVSFVAFVVFVSAFAAEPLRRDLAVARAGYDAGGGGPERTAVPVSAQGAQLPANWPQF